MKSLLVILSFIVIADVSGQERYGHIAFYDQFYTGVSYSGYWNERIIYHLDDMRNGFLRGGWRSFEYTGQGWTKRDIIKNSIEGQEANVNWLLGVDATDSDSLQYCGLYWGFACNDANHNASDVYTNAFSKDWSTRTNSKTNSYVGVQSLLYLDEPDASSIINWYDDIILLRVGWDFGTIDKSGKINDELNIWSRNYRNAISFGVFNEQCYIVANGELKLFNQQLNETYSTVVPELDNAILREDSSFLVVKNKTLEHHKLTDRGLVKEPESYNSRGGRLNMISGERIYIWEHLNDTIWITRLDDELKVDKEWTTPTVPGVFVRSVEVQANQIVLSMDLPQYSILALIEKNGTISEEISEASLRNVEVDSTWLEPGVFGWDIQTVQFGLEARVEIVNDGNAPLSKFFIYSDPVGKGCYPKYLTNYYVLEEPIQAGESREVSFIDKVHVDKNRGNSSNLCLYISGQESRPNFSEEQGRFCIEELTHNYDYEPQEDIALSPNPTNGFVKIENCTSCSFEVYDGLGRMLKHGKVDQGNYGLNNHGEGIFFYVIYNGNGQVVKREKVIKQ